MDGVCEDGQVLGQRGKTDCECCEGRQEHHSEHLVGIPSGTYIGTEVQESIRRQEIIILRKICRQGELIHESKRLREFNSKFI